MRDLSNTFPPDRRNLHSPGYPSTAGCPGNQPADTSRLVFPIVDGLYFSVLCHPSCLPESHVRRDCSRLVQAQAQYPLKLQVHTHALLWNWKDHSKLYLLLAACNSGAPARSQPLAARNHGLRQECRSSRCQLRHRSGWLVFFFRLDSCCTDRWSV